MAYGKANYIIRNEEKPHRSTHLYAHHHDFRRIKLTLILKTICYNKKHPTNLGIRVVVYFMSLIKTNYVILTCFIVYFVEIDQFIAIRNITL